MSKLVLWSYSIQRPPFMVYQRDPASLWCSGRPLALPGQEITISIIIYKSLALNKKLKIHYTLQGITATLRIYSILCQYFSCNVQRHVAPSVLGFFFAIYLRFLKNRGRRLCIVASWFVLLRLRCVTLCNREDLKGWLAAEQSEKAWRQAQRFPVAAFATLS